MLQLPSALQLITSLILIAATYLIYSRIIKPYRSYIYYKKILTENYRTQVNPFTLTGLSHMKKRQHDLKQHGDTHYQAKRQLTKYQLRLMKVGNGCLIDLIDPELIKEYYEKTKEKCYEKNLENPGSASLMNLIGSGLFLSEGEEWKKKKKILSNLFTFDFIRSTIPLIVKMTQEKIKLVQEQQVNKGKNVVTVDITALLQRIFGNVVIKSFFGDIYMDKLGGQDIFSYITTMIQMNTKRSTTVFAALLGKNFYKYKLRDIDREVSKRSEEFKAYSLKVVNQLIQDFKKDDKKGVENKGLIGLVIKNNLVNTETDDTEGHQKYTIPELVHEMATFFVAGTETTATVLSALIYVLAQRPDLFSKAKEEVNSILKSKNVSDIKEQVIKKCQFIDCLIKEALRMYPPAPTLAARVVTKDHYLGKIPMKKGLQVSVKILTNHYKEEYWKDPMNFDPERWREATTGKQSFSYFPFSVGHRICIGQHLAVLEAKTALIALLATYKQFKIDKPNFKVYERFAYGPELMTTFLTKEE